MSEFTLKTKVLTDESVNELLASLANERIWIGCDPFLVNSKPVMKIIDTLNEKNEIRMFSDIEPDPPISKVASGVKSYHGFQPTKVFAIGGGSAIDTVKSVRYFCNLEYHNTNSNKLYVVPSTSGTGSEVTSFAVITDSSAQIKYPLVDPQLLPDYALLDTEIVKSCPAKVTAYSGLDALTHGCEALVAKNSTYYSDSLAEKAIEIIFDELFNCYSVNLNADYSKMQQASCIAGCAFENAGLGLSHAIAHQIGGVFHVPHGLANAILLPKIIQFNSQDSKSADKYAILAQKLFPVFNRDREKSIQELILQINNLAAKMNCPRSLSEFGISKKRVADNLEKIVTNTKKDFTFSGNPIMPTDKDIVQIILSII